jgi:DNA-binding IclR family transcriptional regulator
MSDGSKPGRKPRVTDEEILQLFRDTDDPVLSTAEVAEQLPIKRSATYKRLAALRDEGKLNGKEIGGRNNVWWFSNE